MTCWGGGGRGDVGQGRSLEAGPRQGMERCDAKGLENVGRDENEVAEGRGSMTGRPGMEGGTCGAEGTT